MRIEDIKTIFSSRYPYWNVYYEESGKAIWISMNDGGIHFFEIQVTPDEGVGLSVRPNRDEIHFAGHDCDGLMIVRTETVDGVATAPGYYYDGRNEQYRSKVNVGIVTFKTNSARGRAIALPRK
ncbi:hypothetical protein [Paenibacillus daejeonensis]|uniref:hypothetical protein n=1 Tax=Paenibacillus daejeonensis TaxID=135193 RepID=UPI00036E90DD|nr:hypothetical protein [Paenibacillus daejeonensis]